MLLGKERMYRDEIETLKNFHIRCAARWKGISRGNYGQGLWWWDSTVIKDNTRRRGK